MRSAITPTSAPEHRIVELRGLKVMLDQDLAALYRVETKALLLAVRRNADRFPADFMFRLSKDESENLRRHFGTSSSWGGRRYLPCAFTEQGVAMLSSVLRSERAVQVNIEIMRAFVRLRKASWERGALVRRIDRLERKYDRRFRAVFDAIRRLVQPPGTRRREIGFQIPSAGAAA